MPSPSSPRRSAFTDRVGGSSSSRIVPVASRTVTPGAIATESDTLSNFSLKVSSSSSVVSALVCTCTVFEVSPGAKTTSIPPDRVNAV